MFSDIIVSCYGSNLLREMVEHPFNIELMNNTLNIESFKFYIQQDTLFLDDYIRALLIIASKVEDIVQLVEVARGTIAISRVLYEHYFTVYGIRRGEKSLACFNFTNFLLSTAYNDTYEAITVLYSCLFIYRTVILSMKHKFKKNNKYKDWFDFYSGGVVESGCCVLESIVDKYCSRVGESGRRRMLELFRITAQFELDFWSSAYNFQNSTISYS